MNGPIRKRLDHEPPEWVGAEAEYFITACAKFRGRNQLCLPRTGQIILDSIRHRNEKQVWFCHLAVIMPDHVHLLLSFPPEAPTFTRIVGDWKHWLARQHRITWQENFFDHRVRAGENYGEKMDYIWQNPVRAGLAKRPEDWLWMFRPGIFP